MSTESFCYCFGWQRYLSSTLHCRNHAWQSEEDKNSAFRNVDDTQSPIMGSRTRQFANCATRRAHVCAPPFSLLAHWVRFAFAVLSQMRAFDLGTYRVCTFGHLASLGVSCPVKWQFSSNWKRETILVTTCHYRKICCVWFVFFFSRFDACSV